jgi:hypothetical protein
VGQIFPAFPTVSHSGQFVHFSHTFVNDSGRHLDDFNVFGITIDRIHVLTVIWHNFLHDIAHTGGIAFRAGFADRSPFPLQFKRIVGVTPRPFRISARIS